MLDQLLFEDADTDAKLWANAVRSAGGFVTGTQLNRVTRLFRGMKADGRWQAFDDGWLLLAENVTQSLVSLRRQLLGAAVNSPVFTPGGGTAFDGATQYNNTTFNPLVHGVAMTASNIRLAVYELTNVAATRYAAGSFTSGSRTLRIQPRTSGSNFVGGANTANVQFTYANNDSRGLKVIARTGPNPSDAVGYDRGVPLTRDADPSSVGTLPPNVPMFIGGYNDGGVLTLPKATTIGVVVVGASLTPAQEATESLAWRNYVASWGIAA